MKADIITKPKASDMLSGLILRKTRDSVDQGLFGQCVESTVA